MKLRRQLIIVSLLTLSLPWAGCQYIREMESALRFAQASGLNASARAIAARFSNEPDLLPRNADLQGKAEYDLYLHPLSGKAIIDGYDDDWRSFELAPQVYPAPNTQTINEDQAGGLSNPYSSYDNTLRENILENDDDDPSGITSPANHDTPLHVKLRLGEYRTELFAFFEISDRSPDHYHPGQGKLRSADHIVIRLGSDHKLRDYILTASGATGSITARYINTSGQIRREHRIRGYRRETRHGYQMEIRIPKKLTNDRMSFGVYDAQQPDQLVGTLTPDLSQSKAHHGVLVATDPTIKKALDAFAEQGSQLSIVDFNQWILASNGDFRDANAPDSETHWVLAWLYRAALGSQALPFRPNTELSGYLNGPAITDALAGNPTTKWYQLNQQRIGRAAAPIINNGKATGAVIVEQSSEAMLALTNAAFNRLLFYSLIAIAFAGIGLLTYASWLSWRIRKLARAAEAALDDSGQISSQLPLSGAGDEVGDLSRSFGQLLSRLSEYTEYLRTLSSKLSHELRTPLAVVRTSLDNLEHESLPESASTYHQRAKEGSARLSAILTAMSAAHRVEESIKHAEMESVQLDALLTEVIDAYRSVYTQHQLELSIAPNASGYSILASPDLLVQMLDKLIDNAADFCPLEETICIDIAPGGDTNGLTEVIIRVTNPGPTLPDAMQGQLFDSLVSIRSHSPSDPDSTQRRRSEPATHLGLGLHIVKLIAHHHGGRVNARNAEAYSGATFEIYLRRA